MSVNNQISNTSNNQLTVYIALEQSTLIEKQDVTIGDVGSFFCIDNDINSAVKKTHCFKFDNNEYGQKVISVMKIIEIINKQFENVTVISIGEPETILYFKKSKNKSKIKAKIKAFFILILAFLGSAYSIMSFNLDVNTRELLTNLHEIFIGEPPFGPTIAVIFYSIGLFIGMLVFFNHGITSKLTDDPTPLQVQMRIYEQDVNTAITVDSSRNKETLDVD